MPAPTKKKKDVWEDNRSSDDYMWKEEEKGWDFSEESKKEKDPDEDFEI